MTSVTLRRAVAAALALNALIHLVLVPEYLGEQAYVGLSFIGLAAVSAWGAYRVLGDDARGWTVAALASAGAFAGFLLSRTVGLPGFHPTDWELSGLLTLVLEAGVVVAFLAHGRRTLSAPSTA